MFKLKTVAVAALAAVMMTGTALANDWSKIRVGTEGAYKPFNYMDSNGELQGFDVEIAKALCEEMKAECTFVAQDWDGIIPALLTDKFDIIMSGMTLTQQRNMSINFVTVSATLSSS